MYKKYFTNFLNVTKGTQYFANEAYYLKSDVAVAAEIQYLKDSPKSIDTLKITETKKMISDFLNLKHRAQVILDTSLNDLVNRLLTEFAPRKKLRVLTTDSESYAFDCYDIYKVKVAPFDNFIDRFIDKIKNHQYDLIFFSQVFFNSGMIVKNLSLIIEAVQDGQTLILIDGRYGFLNIPTDLSHIGSRIFYIGGSNSIAQADDAPCFLTVPMNQCSDSFNSDPKINLLGLYKMNAYLHFLKKNNLTIEKIHAHIQRLQHNFREHLFEIDHHFLTEKNILSVDYSYHGYFLSFAMPSPEHANKLKSELKSYNIITDCCENKLQFGFGLHQNDTIDLSALKLNK